MCDSQPEAFTLTTVQVSRTWSALVSMYCESGFEFAAPCEVSSEAARRVGVMAWNSCRGSHQLKVSIEHSQGSYETLLVLHVGTGRKSWDYQPLCLKTRFGDALG